MEPVPQKVLNWLHSVLLGEYQDVNRTYSDIARTLSDYRSLRPSTDVYTFEDGRSSLLLHITGTIPVSFRGALYSFPISIWVPQSYPREAPMSFVTPTAGMNVRPGQHVSGEGRIYHPYLAGWRPDRSSVAELVRILQDIFAREPPVIAKQTQTNRPPPPSQGHPQQQNGAAPPVPPLPPELAGPGTPSQAARPQPMSPSQPPAPPPKPFSEQRRSSALAPNSPPPVPPHPQQSQYPSGQQSVNMDGRASGSPHAQSFGPSTNHRYSGPPPIPPQQGQQRLPSMYDARRGPMSPPGPGSPPAVAAWAQEQANQQRYQQLPPPGPPQPPAGYNYQQAPNQYPPSYSQQPQPPPQQPAQPRSQPPPPDLLTSPFDPPLPTSSSPLPAPQVPPNPEKDALLSALSRTLTQQLHSTIESNKSAEAPLRAQHTALQHALQNLHAEKSALDSLASTLAHNESILHTAMRDADATIARAKDMPVPGVDEVLVAPTVVGGQLYELAAEERSCREAREVLARALDKGRVGVEGWVKSTRGLAREEFRAKWLVRKAAEGMGLVGAEKTSTGGGWI